MIYPSVLSSGVLKTKHVFNVVLARGNGPRRGCKLIAIKALLRLTRLCRQIPLVNTASCRYKPAQSARTLSKQLDPGKGNVPKRLSRSGEEMDPRGDWSPTEITFFHGFPFFDCFYQSCWEVHLYNDVSHLLIRSRISVCGCRDRWSRTMILTDDQRTLHVFFSVCFDEYINNIIANILSVI